MRLIGKKYGKAGKSPQNPLEYFFFFFFFFFIFILGLKNSNFLAFMSYVNSDGHEAILTTNKYQNICSLRK